MCLTRVEASRKPFSDALSFNVLVTLRDFSDEFFIQYFRSLGFTHLYIERDDENFHLANFYGVHIYD